MIGEVIGAIVGKNIDESDGEGGALGAVMGAATALLLKRLVPLAITGAGILVAKHYIDRIDEPG